jgi:hypothetical protein
VPGTTHYASYAEQDAEEPDQAVAQLFHLDD